MMRQRLYQQRGNKLSYREIKKSDKQIVCLLLLAKKSKFDIFNTQLITSICAQANYNKIHVVKSETNHIFLQTYEYDCGNNYPGFNLTQCQNKVELRRKYIQSLPVLQNYKIGINPILTNYLWNDLMINKIISDYFN